MRPRRNRNRRPANFFRLLPSHVYKVPRYKMAGEVPVLYKGKKRSFVTYSRRETVEAVAANDFFNLSVLHALFPRNSRVPIAFVSGALKGKKEWGFISEMVKNETSDCRQYHEWRSEVTRLFDAGKPDEAQFLLRNKPPGAFRHEQFVDEQAFSLLGALRKTGIGAEPDPMFVYNVRGNPVFGLVSKLDLSRLSQFAAGNASKRLILIKFFERMLQNSHNTFRERAISALFTLHAVESSKKILALKQDPDETVRYSAELFGNSLVEQREAHLNRLKLDKEAFLELQKLGK